MLVDVINQQWQALAQLIRGSKRLGHLKLKALFARKLSRKKPSVAVAIGKRRQANALEEYQRRFPSTARRASELPAPPAAAGQGFRESPLSALALLKPNERAVSPEPRRGQGLREVPQPPLTPLKPPEPAAAPERQLGQSFNAPPQPPLIPSKWPEPAATPEWQPAQDFREPQQPPLTPSKWPEPAATPEWQPAQDFREPQQPPLSPSKWPEPAATPEWQPAQDFREPLQPPLTPSKWPEPAAPPEWQPAQDFREPLQPPLTPSKWPEPAAAPEWQPAQDFREPPQAAPEPLRAPEQTGKAGQQRDQGFREAPHPPLALKPPERAGKVERQRRQKARGRGKRDQADWIASLNRSISEAWGQIPLEIRQRRNEFIAAAAACAIVFGGAYGYRAMKADRPGSRLPRAAQVTPPAVQPVVDERPKNPAVPAPSQKLYYDRLPAEETETATETATAAAPAPAPAAVAAPAPVAAGAPVAAAGPVKAPASAGAVAEAAQPASAPASSPPPVAAQAQSDRPTIVRAERYLPDGTRTDLQRPAAVPAVAGTNAGEVPSAVLAAAEPKPAAATDATQQTEGAPAAPPPAQAAAEPAPALSGGYFAQVKSDQNLKAAEAELAAVAEKYKGVLGEVPLTTRQADLKDRGTWFRVLAGPVKSHDDADNLCRRLKSAGIQDCIVQKVD